MWKKVLLGFSFAALTGDGASTWAQDLDQAGKALKLISDFANSICSNPPLSGTANSVELSGSGKAEVAKLVKQLADLKVEGAAKYQQSEYAGLLQKDLAGAIKDSANCKQKVFNDLNDKLLPKPKVGSGVPAATSNESIHQSVSGSENIGIGRVEGNVYIDRHETQPPPTIVQAAKEDAERVRESALNAGAKAFEDEWKRAEERYVLGQSAYHRHELNTAREIFSRSVQDFDRLRIKALLAETERKRMEVLNRPTAIQDAIVASSKPGAYIWLQGGRYGDMQGVVKSGTTITDLKNKSWTKYSEVNFGAQGSRGFVVKIAAPQEGGQIDVHLDAITEKPITRLRVASTGSPTTFLYQTGTTPLVQGYHDVYLVYNGIDQGTLDAFGFTNTTPPRTPSAATVGEAPFASQEGARRQKK